MIEYDKTSILENDHCVMRLILDRKYQNKGYGRESMRRILEFIRIYPAEATHY